MRLKHLPILLIVFGLFTMSSCNKENLFEQPSVEVLSMSLLELPGEYAFLELDVLVTNNDKREAKIQDVEYQAVIEGFTAETELVEINQMILKTEPLALTLPLTLKTQDAIQLLQRMEAGENLGYVVTGTFHVDEPVKKLFDLPLNVEGAAKVNVGFADFYEQPDVDVDNISIESSEDNGDTFTYDFNVVCTVTNVDPRAVTIDEVEYIVNIEGIESETHLYSDTYSSSISVTGGGDVSLTLPVTISMSSSEQTTLNDAISSGTLDYHVEGTFHAIEVDGSEVDFMLPLFVEGNVNVQELFEQPDITVNSMSGTYSIAVLPPSYTINMDVNSTIQNMDTRDVLIDEVEYVVTVEGVVSDTHWYSDAYPGTNISIVGSGSVVEDLPVTFHITDIPQASGLVAILLTGTANYVIEGTFHAIEVEGIPIDITLPLYDEGTCTTSVIEVK